MNTIMEIIKKNERILSYLFFGALTTLINMVIYDLLFKNGILNNVPSTIIAWIAATIFAFITNKLFVFKSKRWSRKVIAPEFVKFVACRIGSGVMETVFLFITVDCINGNGTILKLIASGFVMVLNYISGKRVAFKNR